MSDSESGPSGVKRPRLGKKKVHGRVILTQKDLEQYLLDSDDDIGDPDFEESDDEFYSSDSDDSELDLPIPDDNTARTLDNNLHLSTPVTSPIIIPTPQPKQNTASQIPAEEASWDTVEELKELTFTRQRELLVQPNGKFYYILNCSISLSFILF